MVERHQVALSKVKNVDVVAYCGAVFGLVVWTLLANKLMRIRFQLSLTIAEH